MARVGNKIHSKAQKCHLFNRKYPDHMTITQSVVSKVKKKLYELGYVCARSRSDRQSVTQYL